MTPYYRQKVSKLDLDPNSIDGEAAATMLAALKYGCKRLAILSRVTGVSYASVKRIARNLRGGGVWRQDGITYCQWDDPENGGIAFLCDVSVATGLLCRSLAAPTSKGVE